MELIKTVPFNFREKFDSAWSDNPKYQVQVHLYYDMPLSFSFKENDKYFLAYINENDNITVSFYVFETIEPELKSLIDNETTIRDFMAHCQKIYLIELCDNGKVETFEADFKEIENEIPREGIYLTKALSSDQDSLN